MLKFMQMISCLQLLDSTIRRVMLPASGEAVIADTVGFIQDLPHELVEAFQINFRGNPPG